MPAFDVLIRGHNSDRQQQGKPWSLYCASQANTLPMNYIPPAFNETATNIAARVLLHVSYTNHSQG